MIVTGELVTAADLKLLQDTLVPTVRLFFYLKMTDKKGKKTEIKLK